MRNMEISTRRMSKRSQEPVDQWLVKEGYFRKHTPRDPTCLFRAISEQVYLTQYYHIRVRKECIEYMKKMRHLFEKSVPTSFDNYLEQMACFTEWGSVNEIQAMSLLYKKDIIVFNGQKQTCEIVTDNDFKDIISLCHTAPKQYETIYKMDFVQVAAYCQSIVYEILYKEIFNMPNIATIVHKMLHDRNSTFRHDKFFLKGNLDIREQLTIDLYNKVESGNSNNISEAQTELRGIPPIPYKVAKALDPGIYRNTDFDIWHEMRQEVKYAGWSRHSNNELQIGGKCLIQINYNDDLDRSNNNHYCVNSMKYDTNGNNTKIVQQKSKQENSCFCGYIQEMGTNEEPVLVFIEELGEKRIVPFAALKPLPLKKNKQNNWIPTNKKNGLTDSTRRWRKTYNATSRKRKDNINITNGLTNNRNTADNNSINSISKTNYESDGCNTESSKLDQHQISENYVVEKSPIYATNEQIKNMPMAVMLNNSQSATTNNIIQEIDEEHKKPNTFMKHNIENSSTNKTAKFAMSNNSNNSIQNLYSKQKLLEENYSPSINNSQMNMNNPNLIYVAPDGNSYPLFSYFPGNLGDNQMDHLFASRFFYNLGLEYLRVNQTWNYGPIVYGPNQHGTQPLGIPLNPPVNANNVPYIQEEVVHFVNEVQNYSLPHNEGGYNSDGREIVESVTKMPLTSINGMQNVKQQKQGTQKNLSGKESLYQASEKSKQNNSITNKVNKVRHQNSHEPAYAQTHQNQYDLTIPSNPAYDVRKIDAHIQNFDPMIQQTIIAPNSSNGCMSPYTALAMFPTLSFYPNEAETCCNPYYNGANGAFLPFQCAPPQPDVAENNMQPYASHIYPGTDTYPPNYPATLCSPIMFSPPVPCSILPSPPNMQEHWYPILGQPHYMQYAPPPISITETSGNGQSPNGSP